MASSLLLAVLLHVGLADEICVLKVPEMQVRITRLVRDGERLMAAARPCEAEVAWREAARLIRVVWSSPAMRELLPLVHDRLARAEGSRPH